MPAEKGTITGLRGLSSVSATERNDFYRRNRDYLSQFNRLSERDKAAETLFINKQYIDRYGIDDFRKHSSTPEDFEWRRNRFDTDAIIDKYPNYKEFGDKWIDILSMTPEGKERFLNSDYKTKAQLEDEVSKRAKERQKDVDNYQQLQDSRPWWAKLLLDANRDLGDERNVYAASNVAGAIDVAKATSDTEENTALLDKIINDDIKKKTGSPVMRAAITDKYNSLLKDNDDMVKFKFNNIFVNKDSDMVKLRKGEFAAYSDIAKSLSIDEMRWWIAKYNAYNEYLPETTAAEALNNEAKDYVADNQETFKKARAYKDEFFTHMLVNLGNIVNFGRAAYYKQQDIRDKGVNVWTDPFTGEVVSPDQVKFDKDGAYRITNDGQRRGLVVMKAGRYELFQNGLNFDGSPDKDLLSTKRLNRAEMFNTFVWDEQEQYEKLGASPYSAEWGVGNTAPWWWEASQMGSFMATDAITGWAFGWAGKGFEALSKLNRLTKWAEEGSKLSKAFAKTMIATNKGLGITTSKLPPVLSAFGISHAYGNTAFSDTYMQNMESLQNMVNNKASETVQNNYKNNKEFKQHIDNSAEAQANNALSLLKGNKIDADALKKQIGTESLTKEVLVYYYKNALLNKATEDEKQKLLYSKDYAKLQEQALAGAGNAAIATAIPEAFKYVGVNFLGHRAFIFKNAGKATKSAEKAAEEAAKKTSSKVGGKIGQIEEYTTKEGTKRIEATTWDDLTTKQKALKVSSIIGKQAWGGAWTNGTDEITVDAAQGVNNDHFKKLQDQFYTGKALNDTYDLADSFYSYLRGAVSSLGQANTMHAAFVGATGSLMSIGVHPLNIAKLIVSKEARKSYKDQFWNKDEIVRDEHGLIMRNKDGSPKIEHSSKKTNNLLGQLNYFISHGVLSGIYEAQQHGLVAQQHADYVNKILEDNNDFKDLAELLATNRALDDVMETNDTEQKKTTKFYHALKAASVLKRLANGDKDPTSVSSVITRNKALVDQLAQQEFDLEKDSLPTDPKDPSKTDPAVTNLINQYWSEAENKSIPHSEENAKKAWATIIKNAKDFKKASDAYETAEKVISEAEKSKGSMMPTSTREALKVNWAMDKHWRERRDQMQKELGDARAYDIDELSSVDAATLTAALGGHEQAQIFSRRLRQTKEQLDKEVAAQEKKVNAAEAVAQASLQALATAKDKTSPSLQQTAQKSVETLQNEREQLGYLQDRQSAAGNHLSIIENAIKSQKEAAEKDKTEGNEPAKEKVLTAEEIMQLPPILRAFMLRQFNWREEGQQAETYSKEQRAELQKLVKDLTMKDPDAVQKIQDIATLTRRIRANKDAYTRMMRNPEAAAVQFEAQQEHSMEEAAELYNVAKAQEADDLISALDKATEGEDADSSADNADEASTASTANAERASRTNKEKRAVKSRAFRFLRTLSTDVLDIMSRNGMAAKHRSALARAQKWSEAMSSVIAVAANMYKDRGENWLRNFAIQIGNIVDSSNSAQEALDALESYAAPDEGTATSKKNRKRGTKGQSKELRDVLNKYKQLVQQQAATNHTNGNGKAESKESRAEKRKKNIEERNERRKAAGKRVWDNSGHDLSKGGKLNKKKNIWDNSPVDVKTEEEKRKEQEKKREEQEKARANMRKPFDALRVSKDDIGGEYKDTIKSDGAHVIQFTGDAAVRRSALPSAVGVSAESILGPVEKYESRDGEEGVERRREEYDDKRESLEKNGIIVDKVVVDKDGNVLSVALVYPNGERLVTIRNTRGDKTALIDSILSKLLPELKKEITNRTVFEKPKPAPAEPKPAGSEEGGKGGASEEAGESAKTAEEKRKEPFKSAEEAGYKDSYQEKFGYHVITFDGTGERKGLSQEEAAKAGFSVLKLLGTKEAFVNQGSRESVKKHRSELYDEKLEAEKGGFYIDKIEYDSKNNRVISIALVNKDGKIIDTIVNTIGNNQALIDKALDAFFPEFKKEVEGRANTESSTAEEPAETATKASDLMNTKDAEGTGKAGTLWVGEGANAHEASAEVTVEKAKVKVKERPVEKPKEEKVEESKKETTGWGENPPKVEGYEGHYAKYESGSEGQVEEYSFKSTGKDRRTVSQEEAEKIGYEYRPGASIDHFTVSKDGHITELTLIDGEDHFIYDRNSNEDRAPQSAFDEVVFSHFPELKTSTESKAEETESKPATPEAPVTTKEVDGRKVTVSVENSKQSIGISRDELVTKDSKEGITDEELKAENINKDAKFTATSFEEIDGKWYANGTFEGNGKTVRVELKDGFDIEKAISDENEQRKNNLLQEGTDVGDPYVKVNEDGSVEGASPSLDEQTKLAGKDPSSLQALDGRKDTALLNAKGESMDDGGTTTSDNTLSATSLPEFDKDALADKKMVHRKGAKEGDALNRCFGWLKSAGVKLQNIIDHEVGRLYALNPDMKIKFMAVNPSGKATDDAAMQNVMMLVVDYDNSVNKGITRIHNEENGGVVTVGGKQYLIVGTLGYGTAAKGTAKHNSYDLLWGEVGKSAEKDGIVKAGAKNYFSAHPEERYYVHEGLSTEIVPETIIPGWLVKQTESDKKPDFRSITELIKDSEGKGRNPMKLTLGDLVFGIQGIKEFMTTRDDVQVMAPIAGETENLGDCFVLIPASNGKYIPAYVKPLNYREMKAGALADRVDGLLHQVVSNDYNTRLAAVKQLARIFYFSKNGDNIVLRKNSNRVGLAHEGKVFADFQIDNSFNVDDFMAEFKKLNPRVSITMNLFTYDNKRLFNEFIEAGAFQMDVASLGTVGSRYSIYALDSDGKMIIPEGSQKRQDGTSRTDTSEEVVYDGQYYTYTDGKYYLNGEAVTDSKLTEQLDLNHEVFGRGGEIRPNTAIGLNDYFIMSRDTSRVIEVNKTTKKARVLGTDEAKKIIEQADKEQAERERKAKAKEALANPSSKPSQGESGKTSAAEGPKTTPPAEGGGNAKVNPVAIEEAKKRVQKPYVDMDNSNFSNLGGKFSDAFEQLKKPIEGTESQAETDSHNQAIADLNQALIYAQSTGVLQDTVDFGSDSAVKAAIDDLAQLGITTPAELINFVNDALAQKGGSSSAQAEEGKGKAKQEGGNEEGGKQTPPRDMNVKVTKTFDEVIKDFSNKRQILKAVKSKWPDAPKKAAELKEFLRDKGLEVEAIDASEEGMKAWLDALKCR